MSTDSIRSEQVPFISKVINEIPQKFSGFSMNSVISLISTVLLAVVGYWLFSYSAWFAMPITWCFLGLVFTGLNAIGYECGRGSFSKNEVVNAIVGNIVCWPLLLPYETWNLQTHQKMFENTFQNLSISSGWWLSSVWQWLKSNFDFSSVFDTKHKTQIIRSIVAQYAFILIFFPLLGYFAGSWGIVKYWLVPWITYHIWMSSFITNVYRVPFIDLEASGYLVMPTKYPIWLEYITHDINYVISATRSISSTLNEVPNHKLKPVYDFILDKMDKTEPKVLQNKLAINFVYLSPILSIYGIISTELQIPTLILTCVLFVLGAVGLVMGYHRLFAHRSFKASEPLKAMLLLAGSSTFVGSCINWCRDHRNHHHFSGTDLDPFDSKKGVLHAHLSSFKEQDRAYMNEEYHPHVHDLENDRLVQLQDKYYPYVATFCGVIVPTLIAGLGWGDFKGGFLFSSIVRSMLNMHSGLAMNSLTHFFGTQKYTKKTSARDSTLLSFLTFGEGNQNFHHAHPSDYRNSVSTFGFDPVKYIIQLGKILGFCSNLKQHSLKTITTTKVKLEESLLDEMKKNLYWGTPLAELEEMTWEQVKEKNSEEDKYLVIVDNIVYDVSNFLSLHPGGDRYLKAYSGRDATDAFNGKVYEHSNAGRNVARTLRVGKIIENIA